jgi:hypothetical protein
MTGPRIVSHIDNVVVAHAARPVGPRMKFPIAAVDRNCRAHGRVRAAGEVARLIPARMMHILLVAWCSLGEHGNMPVSCALHVCYQDSSVGVYDGYTGIFRAELLIVPPVKWLLDRTERRRYGS